MVKAIIFDFDGVIHDTFHIGLKVNTEIDPEMTVEKYKDHFNGNLYNAGHKASPEFIKKFFEIQEKEFESLIIAEEIKEELLKLKQNHKLFIITSNSESTLQKYFMRSKIPNLFDDILGVETHISKVEKFKMVFSRYQLESKDCIFVTDTLGDLMEAKNVAVKSIAVDYGFHDVERLKKGNPFKIISHIKEIEGLI